MVNGRVQGVGFRFTTKQKAMDYDLKGWVKNLPNGTVEIEIEGNDLQVEDFLSDLKEGFNPFIKVNDVLIIKKAGLKGYKNFEIR
jgi:acylphosphatase